MAGQTLETMIVINATTGSGFGEVGNTLFQLGAEIDRISQRLIDFGKDSLKTYEDYEKNMSEARVALATIYGRDTKALDDVMKQLDTSAREWASSTIFHTDDVGNAITEAARAGWDYNQIMAGIPVAMELAQAGSIDLSEALYYITETAKAGGIAFEDLGTFVDEWAFAANSSNGSIASFGDTMLRLGSVMKFADSREELLSLIAIMHDTGTEGSTAATLLRTAMMNILAPSGTAGTVLEQLGATEEEIESIRQDTSKLEALEILSEHGFSAFDDAGQAKPILTIFNELGATLAEIAGGYDLIDKNETTLGVLGTIFGKRGITGALNIISLMEKAEDLRDQMLNGEAIDYGEFASGTMMDTYYGSLETWESKLENLKLRTGDVLAAQVEPVLETVGGIVDAFSSLDTGEFNVLVAGAEVLAAAGPGLIMAGSAFRFIDRSLAIFADPTAGAIAAFSLAAIGITELMAAMDAFEQADYASQFGEMGLDNAAILTYIQQINEDFNTGFENINAYKEALDQCVESYTTASSTFKSSLTQDVITGLQITEGSEEYNTLMGYGETMINAVREGIENRTAESMAFVNNVWGGDPENIDNPVWNQIISALNAGYEDAVSQAEALGRNLRQALIDAVSNDGAIDAGELANIQSIIDEMNRLMAEQAATENYVKQQELLRKAQTLGLDSINDLAGEMKAVNDANLELAYQENDRAYAQIKNGLDKQLESGEIDTDTYNMLLSEQQTKSQQYIDSLMAANEKAIYDLLNLGISGSNLGGAWAEAQTLAQEYWMNGGIANQEAINQYNSRVTGQESGRVGRYVDNMVYYLGGYDSLRRRADNYESQGDTETAQGFRNIMALYDMLVGTDAGNIGVVRAGVQGAGDYTSGMSDYEQINAMLRGHYGNDTTETVESLYDYLAAQRSGGMEADWQGYLGNDELFRQLANMASEAGTTISGLIENAISTGPVNASMPTTIAPYTGEGDAAQSLRDQGVQVQVNGDTTELQAVIDGADGQNLMTYIDGDATNLNATIQSADGQHITTIVDGDVSQVQSALDSLRNQTISVSIRANTTSVPGASVKGFATGGRATEPSIFGEGDTAEWAIPEEHSPRTAQLLDAARSASGFTWPELLSLYGGFNANPNNSPATLVYSPTIYAQNADGVEEKLSEDKNRLGKWYREMQMRDRMEVYA